MNFGERKRNSDYKEPCSECKANIHIKGAYHRPDCSHVQNCPDCGVRINRIDGQTNIHGDDCLNHITTCEDCGRRCGYEITSDQTTWSIDENTFIPIRRMDRHKPYCSKFSCLDGQPIESYNISTLVCNHSQHKYGPNVEIRSGKIHVARKYHTNLQVVWNICKIAIRYPELFIRDYSNKK